MCTVFFLFYYPPSLPLSLSLGLLSFIAQTYEVGEGDKYVSVGVRRVVNPGTNTFFFSAVINDGTAKGIAFYRGCLWNSFQS